MHKIDALAEELVLDFDNDQPELMRKLLTGLTPIQAAAVVIRAVDFLHEPKERGLFKGVLEAFAMRDSI